MADVYRCPLDQSEVFDLSTVSGQYRAMLHLLEHVALELHQLVQRR